MQIPKERADALLSAGTTKLLSALLQRPTEKSAH